MPEWLNFFLPCIFAFGAYYAGILIRFYGLPGNSPLPLGRQLILGIPVSIGVVTPLLAVLGTAMSSSESNQTSLLGVIGIIMEHGMVFNEKLTQRLHQLVNDDEPPKAPPQEPQH